MPPSDEINPPTAYPPLFPVPHIKAKSTWFSPTRHSPTNHTPFQKIHIHHASTVLYRVSPAKAKQNEAKTQKASADVCNSGNFKMNGSLESIEKIVRSINDAKLDGTNQVVIAPPALYLLKVQSELDAPTEVSAQNAFTESSGAFTGEIAPQQLKDANVHWVILGHSERRSLFGDTDKLVADKVSLGFSSAPIPLYAPPPPAPLTRSKTKTLQTKAALSAGLSVIACIGESLQERESDQTMTVVERQLEAIAGAIDGDAWKRIVIACTSFLSSLHFSLTPPLQTNPSGLLAPAKSQPSPKPKKSTPPSAPGLPAALPPRLPSQPVSSMVVPSMARTVAS